MCVLHQIGIRASGVFGASRCVLHRARLWMPTAVYGVLGSSVVCGAPASGASGRFRRLHQPSGQPQAGRVPCGQSRPPTWHARQPSTSGATRPALTHASAATNSGPPRGPLARRRVKPPCGARCWPKRASSQLGQPMSLAGLLLGYFTRPVAANRAVTADRADAADQAVTAYRPAC